MVQVGFSAGDVGEVLGDFDRYHHRRASQHDAYFGEPAFRVLEDRPSTSYLCADALQVAAAKEAESELFFSADTSFMTAASAEGLTAYNVEGAQDRLKRI